MLWSITLSIITYYINNVFSFMSLNGYENFSVLLVFRNCYDLCHVTISVLLWRLWSTDNEFGESLSCHDISTTSSETRINLRRAVLTEQQLIKFQPQCIFSDFSNPCETTAAINIPAGCETPLSWCILISTLSVREAILLHHGTHLVTSAI